MRVISGTFRGRRLEVPPGLTTRPMTDRVKETLFNILGARFGMPGEVPPFAVLDLFAGTGGLGIEALSRGARSCLFLERDRSALRCLRANIANLGLAGMARVASENAWAARLPAPVAGGFGLVFVDPPYREVDVPQPTLDLLERVAPLLSKDGVVFLRHEWRVKFPVHQLRGLMCDDEREIGRMKLLFLVHPATGDSLQVTSDR